MEDIRQQVDAYQREVGYLSPEQSGVILAFAAWLQMDHHIRQTRIETCSKEYLEQLVIAMGGLIPLGFRSPESMLETAIGVIADRQPNDPLPNPIEIRDIKIKELEARIVELEDAVTDAYIEAREWAERQDD